MQKQLIKIVQDFSLIDLAQLGFCEDDDIPGATCNNGNWQVYDAAAFNEWYAEQIA